MVLSRSISQGSRPPSIPLCPGRMSITAGPPVLPRRPHTAPLSVVSQGSWIRGASPTRSPPQYLGEGGVLHTQDAGTRARPFTVLSHLLGRACLPHRAAASGTGDSTSLPAGVFAAVEAQVCEGSSGLQLHEEQVEEAAEAWAARSR